MAVKAMVHVCDSATCDRLASDVCIVCTRDLCASHAVAVVHFSDRFLIAVCDRCAPQLRAVLAPNTTYGDVRDVLRGAFKEALAPHLAAQALQGKA